MDRPRPNPRQQQAIHHHGTALLVLAGAGSGKTRVITEKVAHISRELVSDPTTVTAVTFTNKAAREMKARLKALQGERKSKSRPWISTFHSLGMRILNSNPELVGLKGGYSIIDPGDALNIAADLIAEQGPRNAELAERAIHVISAWKNDGLAPGQAVIEEPTPASVAAQAIYPDYERYLRACNAVDLDDLIYLPTLALRNDRGFLAGWQEQIRYLLIDEYQDTNGAQYEMVRQLVGNGDRLTVVGDDDQSIYAWRGARPENLMRLSEDYPGLTVVKLEQNYRSAGRILSVANGLIQHNPRPFEKSLWSELGYGDAVEIKAARNDEVEAEKVVSSIMTRQFQGNSEYRDFAVLYRSNHQARMLETKLREMRIPYRLSGGMSFFERSEIRDIMAYLRLIANNDDDTAFMRIINTPRRGIGATTLERISTLATQNDESLLETLFDERLAEVVSGRQLPVLRQFGEWIVALGDRAQRGDVGRAVKDLVEECDYERWLIDSTDEATAERRMENIASLLEWVEALSEKEDEKGLSGVLSRLLLSDILDRQDDDSDSNLVNLMTLHASKGLEYPHVYIVGLEEEVLPHRNSIREDSIDEERRLFYVGITRAMRTLSLSYCMVRKRFGELLSCEPSRFLEELPVEDLAWENRETRDEDKVQESGRAHLAAIRARMGR